MKPSLRRLLQLAVLAGLGLGWWLTLAPATVGGPATYIVVSGHSMEPRLHPGDLVIARVQPRYHVGDLVVFRYGHGQVVHDLLAHGALGWRTKGEHNRWIDPWWVKDSAIVGRHLVTVPRFGSFVRWTAGNPAVFGLAAALVVGLGMLPLPRRRSHLLEGSLASARHEEPVRAMSRDAWLLNGVCAASAAVSLVAALVLGRFGRLHSIAGLIVGVGFCAAATLAWVLLLRGRDGAGLAEPLRSRCALGRRLWLVAELPQLSRPPRRVKDAPSLRRRADRWRVPVLHTICDERDEFLVVGRRRALLLSVEAQPLIERSSPFQKSSRSLNFWSFPVAVRGRASRNSTFFGHL